MTVGVMATPKAGVGIVERFGMRVGVVATPGVRASMAETPGVSMGVGVTLGVRTGDRGEQTTQDEGGTVAPGDITMSVVGVYRTTARAGIHRTVSIYNKLMLFIV